MQQNQKVNLSHLTLTSEDKEVIQKEFRIKTRANVNQKLRGERGVTEEFVRFAKRLSEKRIKAIERIQQLAAA